MIFPSVKPVTLGQGKKKEVKGLNGASLVAQW